MPVVQFRKVNRENAQPTGDIVFVHGLGGDSQTTWTSENSVGKGDNEKEFISYFPCVLATDFSHCNVWVLDYSAHVTKWADNPKFNELPRHCVQTLEHILSDDIGSRPIVFICHSLGGIVVKELLQLSQAAKFDRLKKLYEHTHAVSFIATPHKGSKWANILNGINSVLPFIRTSDRINELKDDNVYLERLSAWYRERALEDKIETQAFYEQKETGGILVVPRYSADPNVIGCNPIPVNKNHIEIAKPQKKTSTVYASLSGLISHHIPAETAGFGPPETPHAIPPQTVVIGVVKNGNKVLMVRRRHPVDNLTWQFVAGRMKVEQETEDECIVREIYEETDIHAKVIRRLGESSDSESPYRRIYYALDYISGELDNGDDTENLDIRWMKINTIEQAVTSSINCSNSDPI